MRIVYLNPCARWGGAETSLQQFLASLRKAEPSWELWLVLGEDGPFAGAARALGVRVMVEPIPGSLRRLGDSGGGKAPWRMLGAALASATYARRLASRLAEIRPAIIHSNGFKMHVLGAWARPRGARLVWHIHDYVSSRPMMSRLLRFFGKACDLAVANSESVAADVGRVLGGTPVMRIYNAVDTERFSPNGKKLDLDALSGLAPADPETVRVGLVATFARWKGHKVFLDALARLAPQLNVRAYVIGGPIYQTEGSQWTMEELRQEVDRLALTGRVGFTGFLEDTPAAMRSLDIVVHASTEPEPFGMVIIEAMACGRAVVASRAGGAGELLAGNERALSHEPGDAAGLAREISRLADDDNLRRRLAEAGRSAAERMFDSKRLAKELVAAYARVCGEATEGFSTAFRVDPQLESQTK